MVKNVIKELDNARVMKRDAVRELIVYGI